MTAPLMAVCHTGQPEAGADASQFDAEGITVLLVAEFYEEMANTLLAAGADVDSAVGNDETVLFKAARLADVAYVKWLLEYDAEPG